MLPHPIAQLHDGAGLHRVASYSAPSFLSTPPTHPASDAPHTNPRSYTMELGCIFHSIIIGVGVGVITGDRQLVIVLMVGGAVV